MENVYPEQTHDQVTVEQIATPEATVLLQTRADTPTGQAKQLDDNPATSAGLGVSEITLRAVCMVSYNFYSSVLQLSRLEKNNEPCQYSYMCMFIPCDMYMYIAKLNRIYSD